MIPRATYRVQLHAGFTFDELPGRADDGNFVLSRFMLEAAPKLPPGQSVPLSRVELHKPRADFNQGGYHIEETLKEGTQAGWAIGASHLPLATIWTG